MLTMTSYIWKSKQTFSNFIPLLKLYVEDIKSFPADQIF